MDSFSLLAVIYVYDYCAQRLERLNTSTSVAYEVALYLQEESFFFISAYLYVRVSQNMFYYVKLIT